MSKTKTQGKTKNEGQSKQTFENWLDNQKKIFEDWMDATKEFQEKFVDKDTIEKGKGVFTSWADTQADFFKKWMKTSEDIFKKPFEGNIFEGTETYYKDWMKSQKDIIDGWKSVAENWQKSVSEMKPFPFFVPGEGGDIMKMYEAWMEQYSNLSTSMRKPIEDLLKKMPSGVGKDVFTQIFNSADVYLKMHEIWLKNQSIFQNIGANQDAFKKLFDPAGYKDILDKVFNFDSPDVLKNMSDQLNKIWTEFNPAFQDNMRRWKEYVGDASKFFPGFITGDAESFKYMHKQMQEIYNKTLNPLMGLNPMFKDPKVNELLQDVMKKSTDYMENYSQFQYLAYMTGQKAMEKLINEMTKAGKDGKGIKSFDDFFKKWVDINENFYSDLFKSEEFSKLQGALVDSGLDIKNDLQHLMESFIKDYPVVRRSEMDELLKTIHELKKRINELEKQGKPKAASTKTKAKKSEAKK